MYHLDLKSVYIVICPIWAVCVTEKCLEWILCLTIRKSRSVFAEEISNYTYTVSQKTGSFSFEHNVGKYCPILIILSLLQTEINCD